MRANQPTSEPRGGGSRPQAEHEIRKEEPLQEHHLIPYMPEKFDLDGFSLSRESLTRVTNKFAPPLDDGAKRVANSKPNQPPKALKISEVLATPDPSLDASARNAATLRNEFEARWELRKIGRELMGDAEKTTPETRQRDGEASVFRADLREYWDYNKVIADALLQVNGAEDTRRDKLSKLADGKLMAALEAWNDAWSRADTDWSGLTKAAGNVQAELAAMGRSIEKLSAGMGYEASLIKVLDTIGREVAREAAVLLPGGPVDLGDRLHGVTYAISLAAPTRMTVDQIAWALIDQGPGWRPEASKSLEAAFKQAREATRIAKGTPWIQLSKNPRKKEEIPWTLELMQSTDKWAKMSAEWQPGKSSADFKTATNDLIKNIDIARREIREAKNPGDGARRIATRAVDSLSVAVAERVDRLTSSNAALKASLGDSARILRNSVKKSAPIDNLSKYWSEVKKGALGKLGSNEAAKLEDNWFTDGLSKSLKDWSALMKKVPKHDREKLLQESWKINDALTRYKVAANTMSNEAARQDVHDAIDLLAGQIAMRLEAARAMYKGQL